MYGTLVDETAQPSDVERAAAFWLLDSEAIHAL
jgi:hypothetical protein